jgi:hypothetical protein
MNKKEEKKFINKVRKSKRPFEYFTIKGQPTNPNVYTKNQDRISED